MVPRLHSPITYLYRPQSHLKKVVLAGVLFVSFVVLHHVCPRSFLLRKATCFSQTPSLHFSILGGTRTAPFGLFVDDDKIWHLYFQSSSLSSNLATHCGSWGHATSPDLYTWSIHDIALNSDKSYVCSGSVVIDRNNTSKFFPNQFNGVVAVYTERRHPGTTTQQLALAYSIDGGYTFTKSSKPPRLPASDDLLHPQITWHEPTQRWIMTATKNTHTTIIIYTSPNLRDWDAASTFTAHDLGILNQGFEYPSLLSIPRINSTGAENLNHPTVPGGTLKYMNDYIFIASSNQNHSPLNDDSGSRTRYIPGTFNGTHFHATEDTTTNRFVDFGPDNYATQFFFGLTESHPIVSLGLITNPHHHNTILTLPRENNLIYDPTENDLSYFSHPFNLSSLHTTTLATLTTSNISNYHITSPTPTLLDLTLEMQPPTDAPIEFNIDFLLTSPSSSTPGGPILCTAIFRTWDADFGCDRSLARSRNEEEEEVEGVWNDRMAARAVRLLLPFHNPAVRRWGVHVVLDGSVVEVFLNGGG